MSLQDWADNRWLRPHRTSRGEIDGLLSLVDRDLADPGKKAISADWRFGIAYNAELKLCTILVHASGFRPEKNQQHYRTLQALPLVLGDSRKKDAAYLETCRIKRNEVEYDAAGGVTDADATELRDFASALRKDVLEWLGKRDRSLLP